MYLTGPPAKMSFNRPISPDSYSSEGDSTKREFFNSARVVTSPTPTPLSETPRDFQLVRGNTELTSPVDGKVSPLPATTNGCQCGPECRERCCVSRGWSSGTKFPSDSIKTVNRQDRSDIGSHLIPSSQISHLEHDTTSIGSSDSGSEHMIDVHGDTPLLSPVEQHRVSGNTAIVSWLVT